MNIRAFVNLLILFFALVITQAGGAENLPTLKTSQDVAHIQCLAEANNLLQDFRLDATDIIKDNKNCINISEKMKKLNVVIANIGKMREGCPEQPSGYSCLSQAKLDQKKSLGFGIAILKSNLATAKIAAYMQVNLDALNKKLESELMGRPEYNEKRVQLEADFKKRADELVEMISPGKYADQLVVQLHNEKVTTVCSKKVDEKAKNIWRKALDQFDSDQSKYIGAYKDSLVLGDTLNDPKLTEKEKKLIKSRLLQMQADNTFYRENLQESHRVLKQQAYEEDAVSRLDVGARIYLSENQITSVTLDNGVALELNKKCHPTVYKRYDETVTSECFSDLNKRSASYGEVCRRQFQWVNQKGSSSGEESGAVHSVK